MRSFWTQPSRLCSTRASRALHRFADELCGELAHAFVYMGVVALMAIIGLSGWNQLRLRDAGEAPVRAGWSLATRSVPAFAVSQFDLSDKTETYEIFRHPEGGRKDILRWSSAGERPIAELEIYRPGGEFNPAETAPAADREGADAPEAAGVIDSKFGTVMLYRKTAAADDGPACLGFIRRFDRPHMRISGWSCQGDTVPAARAAIGCLLSRLVLLSAGNDPRLAELFARAELRRTDCAATAPAARTADWVTTAEKPGLRGAF